MKEKNMRLHRDGIIDIFLPLANRFRTTFVKHLDSNNTLEYYNVHKTLALINYVLLIILLRILSNLNK